MLISSILSPLIPGLGSGPSDPEDPAGGDDNTGGAGDGGNSTGGTTETGGASGQGGSGTQGASGSQGAGASGSHGVSATNNRQNAVSREDVLRRADEKAPGDIDLSRARAERTQKMLLQASLVDGLMRASENDASMALFEREQPAGESAEKISARYQEF